VGAWRSRSTFVKQPRSEIGSERLWPQGHVQGCREGWSHQASCRRFRGCGSESGLRLLTATVASSWWNASRLGPRPPARSCTCTSNAVPHPRSPMRCEVTATTQPVKHHNLGTPAPPRTGAVSADLGTNGEPHSLPYRPASLSLAAVANTFHNDGVVGDEPIVTRNTLPDHVKPYPQRHTGDRAGTCNDQEALRPWGDACRPPILAMSALNDVERRPQPFGTHPF